MNKDAKIYIAGHNGMVGSAIYRKLVAEGYSNFVFRSSKALDLRDQQAVAQFFEAEKPEYIFLAAAKVGGIQANNHYRADFLYDNLLIQSNVIHQAHVHGVKKLLSLGSSCIYPKQSPQPIKEEYLLTDTLEPTNEPYAIAKIAGLKLCESYKRQYGDNFISAMPTNLYGPNDNYDLQNSHVLPALLRKFHEAKLNGEPAVEIWGTGKPRREFLHADDLADAALFLMLNYDDEQWVNVGVGEDISIKELALLIKEVVGFEGELIHNLEKPDGTLLKRLDVSRMKALGWEAKIGLREGIEQTYQLVLEQGYERVLIS
ncbi:MAG: GDP-L-fucose synthase family protein [Flammeovirgaceae bacterium]